MFETIILFNQMTYFRNISLFAEACNNARTLKIFHGLSNWNAVMMNCGK